MNIYKRIRAGLALTMLAGSLTLSAGTCGDNGSYYRADDGVWIVTDCWGKDPCITWTTRDTKQLAEWCFYASNDMMY